MVDAFSVISSALPSATRVLALRGTEALSALYEFQVHLWIEDPAFDMAPALGADMTLSIKRRDEQPYLFHGILATIETVDDVAHGALYRAVLVPAPLAAHADAPQPRLRRARARRRSSRRCSRTGGLKRDDYSLQLTRQLPAGGARLPVPRERLRLPLAVDGARGPLLLLRAGRRRRAARHRRRPTFHEPSRPEPVRFFRVSGAGAGGSTGSGRSPASTRALPASVRLQGLRLHQAHARRLRRGAGLGPGRGDQRPRRERFFTPDAGSASRALRAEEMLARGRSSPGAGRAPSSCGPATRSRSRTTRASFDAKYLVTEVQHFGNQSAGSRRRVGADRARRRSRGRGVPRRGDGDPRRRCSSGRRGGRPCRASTGRSTAVVDGEADSDYAQLDEHGRYLVRIHFDESASRTGRRRRGCG